MGQTVLKTFFDEVLCTENIKGNVPVLLNNVVIISIWIYDIINWSEGNVSVKVNVNLDGRIMDTSSVKACDFISSVRRFVNFILQARVSFFNYIC